MVIYGGLYGENYKRYGDLYGKYVLLYGLHGDLYIVIYIYIYVIHGEYPGKPLHTYGTIRNFKL